MQSNFIKKEKPICMENTVNNTVNLVDEQARINQVSEKIKSLLAIAKDENATAEERATANLELGKMVSNGTLAVVLREKYQSEKKQAKATKQNLASVSEILLSIFQTAQKLVAINKNDKEGQLLDPIVGYLRSKPNKLAIMAQIGFLAAGKGKFANVLKVFENAKNMYNAGEFKQLETQLKTLREVAKTLNLPVESVIQHIEIKYLSNPKNE